MSQWEMLDNGAFNGVAKYIRGCEDGSVDVQHVFHDVSPILDANKRAAIDTMNTRMGDGVEKVASIPANIIYEWITKYGVNLYNPDHQDGVKHLLNSSDYRWLKCREIYI